MATEYLDCSCRRIECPLCFPHRVIAREAHLAAQTRSLARAAHSTADAILALQDPRHAPHDTPVRLDALLSCQQAYALTLNALAAMIRRFEARRGAPLQIKRCACGQNYTREQWQALRWVGKTHDLADHYEYRNCGACGSTLMVRTTPSATTTSTNLTDETETP